MPTPVVNSTIAAVAQVGVAFAFNVTGTNTPTSYSASNLPAGLSINTSTGAITGTPTTAGAVNAVVSAINGSGTGSAGLLIYVAPASGVQPIEVTTKWSGWNTQSAVKAAVNPPAGGSYAEWFSTTPSAQTLALQTAAANSYAADIAGAVSFTSE